MLKGVLSIKNYTVFLNQGMPYKDGKSHQGTLYKDGEFKMSFQKFKDLAMKLFPDLINQNVVSRRVDISNNSLKIIRLYSWDAVLGHLIETDEINQIIK